MKKLNDSMALLEVYTEKANPSNKVDITIPCVKHVITLQDVLAGLGIVAKMVVQSAAISEAKPATTGDARARTGKTTKPANYVCLS